MIPQGELDILCQIGEKIAKRIPIWTQGPGGNVSWKNQGEDLYVKASGKRLDKMASQKGLALVHLPPLKSQLEQLRQSSAQSLEPLYAKTLGEFSETSDSWGRPSMETAFHALLSDRYVIHFHSIVALLMLEKWEHCAAAWREWLVSAQPIGFNIQRLRFEVPGIQLGFALQQVPRAHAYLLTNHGVLLQGDSPGILDVWESVEDSFLKNFNYTDLRFLYNSPDCATLARDKIRRLKPMPFRIFFPDTAVFADRLLKVLEQQGDDEGTPLYSLSRDAWQIDQDACEIWAATQLVFESHNEMPQVPAEMSSKLASLPTEIFRRETSSR